MRYSNQFPLGIETAIPLHTPDLSADELPFAELNWREMDLLEIASLGATVVEASQLFAVGVGQIELMRDEVTTKFAARNMAQAVHHAIQAGSLFIDVAPANRSSKRLARLELGVMAGVANGMTNRQIGLVKEIGRSKNGVDAINRRIFQKINANGRTHTVRRAYQLGIFTLQHY